MRAFVFLLFCLSTTQLSAQSDSVQQKATAPEPFICSLPEMPTFPGGDTAFHRYLRENIVYPDSAGKYRREGVVYIYFEIAANGAIEHARVQRGVEGAPELDAEALRVIRAMPPWNNSQKQRTGMVVPIRFTLH